MLFFDPPVFHFLNANTQSPLWWIEASRLASNWLPGLCALPVIAAMLALGKGWRRSMQLALLSMAVAWVACRLIRWGFPMPRPAQLGMGHQWIAHGASASFPSMHAAGAFALALGINLGVGRHRRWLIISAWVLACSVALSRVVLGVHFPSDVLAGMLTGAASAILVWRCALKVQQARRRRRLKQGLYPQIS
ncbi:MAG: phosphatase PAP2 family protein [Comamonas sp.]|jgi:undecaprenyl-diphosphatase|uniref:phosphatase PAP2 family protein n=1 Tax=Comamonas sp. TaxID=34028 RepID=UPI0028259774|nr:phosphatase PAP2 family protein [Comamonas sp.]MDR0213413.1 phosphatase PAP2 family protein [Comamonas sp.]